MHPSSLVRCCLQPLLNLSTLHGDTVSLVHCCVIQPRSSSFKSSLVSTMRSSPVQIRRLRGGLTRLGTRWPPKRFSSNIPSKHKNENIRKKQDTFPGWRGLYRPLTDGKHSAARRESCTKQSSPPPYASTPRLRRLVGRPSPGRVRRIPSKNPRVLLLRSESYFCGLCCSFLWRVYCRRYLYTCCVIERWMCQPRTQLGCSADSPRGWISSQSILACLSANSMFTHG